MAPSFSSTSLFVLLPLFPSSAWAALPFNSKISQPVLKHSNEVSFDPLGVAAVLNNPRAETSAARLYTQPDRALFRWPHTMMIGGALTPISILADYLSSKFSSIDPAVSICLKDRITLPVRSTMVFPELPVSLSNAWLRDILAFPPSQFPENDFAVAQVDDACIHPNLVTTPAPFTALDVLGLLCGLLILTGLVFSVLTGDVWAITLFLIYAAHWLASTLISFHPPATLQPTPIVPDPAQQFCVYQRPEGGTVVFKGRKDTLERWARTTWIFDTSKKRNGVLHWAWTGTGSLAAVASVACMVNMAADLQLGFLAVLGYSSVAEILATRVASGLQAKARARSLGGGGGGGESEKDEYDEPMTMFVRENRTRTMGIIRATLWCRLDGQMWFKLTLLPDIPVFKGMLALLDQLRAVEDEAVMRGAVAKFVADYGAEKEGVNKLVLRIAEEVKEAWREMKVPTKEEQV